LRGCNALTGSAAAAEAERERLESIFKAKPTTGKGRFTAVSEEAKANMATANARAEEEHKREEARESERAAAAAGAKLTTERAVTAEQALADACEHYDSAMAGELHLSELERGIAAEIAALRANPRAYAAKLAARRAAYDDGNVLTLHDPAGPTLRIKTSDGVAAVDDAIRAVERAQAAPLTLEVCVVVVVVG
jgi:hypothetical protein